MKPTLKLSGTKCLKPQYDGLLSTFAFKFDLRRYAKDMEVGRTSGFRVRVQGLGFRV